MSQSNCCICQQPILARRSDAITCSKACAKERKAIVAKAQYDADIEASREKSRAYRQANHERALERDAQKRAANGERIRASARRYARKARAADPDLHRAKNRAYREENAEAIRQRARERYAADLEAQREAQRQYRLPDLEKYRAWGRAKEAKRRAAKKGAGRIEHVTLAYIAERDGWRCHLCRRKVNPQMSHPNPASPSLDHVIPLSLGGKHTKENVRLAHLGCNVSKRNRAMDEQLLLVG